MTVANLIGVMFASRADAAPASRAGLAVWLERLQSSVSVLTLRNIRTNRAANVAALALQTSRQAFDTQSKVLRDVNDAIATAALSQ